MADDDGQQDRHRTDRDHSTQSNSIAKLAEALSRAQGEIKGAVKGRENPHFKSRYADLASIWEACRAPLAAAGLAVIQTTRDADEGAGVTLVTTLAHTSGEWVRGELTLAPAQATPQTIGSCLTYARRYALAAIVGVAPTDDDDDAESATQSLERPEKSEKPAARRYQVDRERSYSPRPGPITEPQGKRLWALVAAKAREVLGRDLGGPDKKDLEAFLKGILAERGVASIREILAADYEAIVGQALSEIEGYLGREPGSEDGESPSGNDDLLQNDPIPTAASAKTKREGLFK